VIVIASRLNLVLVSSASSDRCSVQTVTVYRQDKNKKKKTRTHTICIVKNEIIAKTTSEEPYPPGYLYVYFNVTRQYCNNHNNNTYLLCRYYNTDYNNIGYLEIHQSPSTVTQHVTTLNRYIYVI